MTRLAHALALCALFVGLGCTPVNAAPTPAATLNFPVSMALSVPSTPGGRSGFVLIGNADFDLRYDQGSLQSYDLDEIERRVATWRRGECPTGQNPCPYEDSTIADPATPGSVPLLVDEVLISPHMAGIAVSPRGDRVYVPSRGESNLTWIDFEPESGHFACDGAGDPVRCGASRRTTTRSDACARAPALIGDPVGAVVGSISTLTGDPADAGRDYVLMLHRDGPSRGGGHASLFLDQMVGGVLQPVLVHRLDGLPVDVVNVSLDPTTGIAWANAATITTSRPARDITLVGVDYDPMRPECSAAFAAGRVGLAGVDDGLDTRDVAFAPDGRYVHVLSRRPEAVATLDLEGRPINMGETPIAAIDAVGFGPSRLDVAVVGGRTLLAVSCFDGRNVWLFDADEHRLLGVVPGFSGPFELVIDPARQLLVVGDFRDSVIRVVDLEPISRDLPPELALRIGRVRPVSVLH